MRVSWIMLAIVFAAGEAWEMSRPLLPVALSESQRAQLATARDRSPQWDEAALYPLLEDVATWSEADEAGAVVPDYARLHASPGAFRGERFLVEGELGAAPEAIRRTLSRPGVWDGRLQQWFVLVNREPDEAVVLVLLDPMPLKEAPQWGGATVRAAVRFYKVWSYVDRNNQPTQYLMFVGRRIKVGDAASGSTGGGGVDSGGGSGGGLWVFVVVLVVLLAAWYCFWRLRRMSLKPKALPYMSRRAERRQAGNDNADQPPAEPLPDDPAEALEQLRRRHDQDTSEPGG